MSLALREGERLALVGANGAGKTTLLRAIAGAHPVAAGTVRLDGVDVTAAPAHRRVALGIALVPEGRRLFPDMTVLDNILAGRTLRMHRGLFWQLVHFGPARAEVSSPSGRNSRAHAAAG